jgi:hypothetical protein
MKYIRWSWILLGGLLTEVMILVLVGLVSRNRSPLKSPRVYQSCRSCSMSQPSAAAYLLLRPHSVGMT